ncbi:unnamed protein product, partial [Discosporangium mesarthrocarpum]
GGWRGAGGGEETISMADLALTLVSDSEPRDLPSLLARVQNLREDKSQIPLKDALLLHEVFDEHARELAGALSLYCQAAAGGVVRQGDFCRAA